MIIPKYRAWHKERRIMCGIYTMNFVCNELDDVWIYYEAKKKNYNFCGNNECSGECGQEYYYSTRDEHCSLHEIQLMQFTGRLDCKKIEIFEGDIVVEDFLSRKGYIKFGEHQTSTDYYASTAYGFYIQFQDGSPYALPCNLKVIGNIYENPGLLEEVK